MLLASVEARNRLPGQRQGVRVVVCQVVCHARQPSVYIATAQILCAHHFACCRFDQRRATQKDRALIFDNDGLVAHGRHIGSASRARPHHHGDLRDASRAHVGLVEENAAEMVAIRKHLILVGQIGAARVDQVHAWQVVLLRDLLRAQVLFDRQRVVGSALDRGVVADDHALHARDAANAGNDPCAGSSIFIHAVSCQRRKL